MNRSTELPRVTGKIHPDFAVAETTTSEDLQLGLDVTQAQSKLQQVQLTENQVAFFALAREAVTPAVSVLKGYVDAVLEASPWEFFDWDLRPDLISHISRVDTTITDPDFPMALEVTTSITLRRRGAHVHPHYVQLLAHPHRRPKNVKIVHGPYDSYHAEHTPLESPLLVQSCTIDMLVSFESENMVVLTEVTGFTIGDYFFEVN